MTLYAFVLTVKYAKEYWVSETYKITNKVTWARWSSPTYII